MAISSACLRLPHRRDILRGTAARGSILQHAGMSTNNQCPALGARAVIGEPLYTPSACPPRPPPYPCLPPPLLGYLAAWSPIALLSALSTANPIVYPTNCLAKLST